MNSSSYSSVSVTTRILTIIHLCIVFSFLTWYASQPFMDELFTIKTDLVLYENIMGHDPVSQSRFLALPNEVQESLTQSYEKVRLQLNKTFTDKLLQSVKLLTLDLPPFFRAWLLLSLVVSIAVLIGLEGARYAAFLLPITILCYGIDGYINHPTTQKSIFPSEQYLIERYSDAPLSSNLFQQKEQLQNAWQSYLLTEWSSSQENRNLEEANFNFTVARIINQKDASKNFYTNSSLLILLMVWNLAYALSGIKNS